MLKAEEQPIGKILDGRYEIMECLGSGGMGVVYKARQHQLDRFVAIKMPHLENISSESSRNRFEREAQTMGKFSHENIVQVYDYNAKCDRPYIALEYIQGQELASLLSRPSAISIGGVLNVLRQIANGIDYAHKYGVIHRDIKPENIVISDKRRCVKIMDFGLVRIEGAISQDTRAGFVVGTPQYMSPEQVRAKKVGPASDIYSFAIIVYCIFAGRLPFDGDGMALMMKHATEPAPNPLDLNPFLPKPLESALLRSLDKSQDARHPTATALVDELDFGLKDKIRYPYSALLRGDFEAQEDALVSELVMGIATDFPELESNSTGSGEAGTIVLATAERRAAELATVLNKSGYKTIRAKSAVSALEYAMRHNPDALVVEEGHPDLSGAAICRILKSTAVTQYFPILYLGNRQSLRTDHLNSKTPVQVLTPDESAETIANYTNALVKKIQEAKIAYDGPTTDLPTQEGGMALAPLLRRLDTSLVRESVAMNLLVGGLRADDVHAVFQRIGEVLKPIFGYRFLYAALFPGTKGENGTLLIDKTDTTADAQTAAAVFQLQQEILRAAGQHKDTPGDLTTFFSKGIVPAEDQTDVSTFDPGTRFVSFPIEDGTRFYGIFGVAYENDSPTPDQAKQIEGIATLAFSSLNTAWHEYLIRGIKDHDELTGAWRRQKIVEYLRLSLQNSNSIEEPFSLALLDIDALDSFNETLGAEGGDLVLSEVARVLDSLGPEHHRVGRIGNDEFLVVMPGAAINDSMKYARTALQQIGEIELSATTPDLRVKASIGLAFRALEEKSADYLMRAARNALKAVKDSGGGNVRATG